MFSIICAHSSHACYNTATCQHAGYWAVNVPHLLSCIPSEDLAPLNILYADMPIELDGIGHNQSLNLPWVAKCKPVVRLLMLEPVNNVLHAYKEAFTYTGENLWHP
jgi:hypothetical protein